ncbi:tetratricopeptide repeat protein, partial [Micromonospora sp. CPCC 205371]|nr:tetratricopeptide repeat protein [Micromonospora sp. CPCC 205371]
GADPRGVRPTARGREAPPPGAGGNLRTYVRGLRGRLSDDAIITRPHGYAAAVEPAALDLTLFEARAEQARGAWGAGDAAGALRLLEDAIGLWRGRLLEDLPASPAWEAVESRLTALKTSLVELAMEIRIGLGQHEVAAAELRGLLATDPLHEGFWRRLVLALHASGRTAEALRAYADARQVLADELGVEPGPQLRAAFDLVLRAAPQAPGPICQLPIDPPDFTGRGPLVDQIVAHLTGRHPAVVAISGAPGVGKSALAVHVGHAVRAAFPDGQLYVDMRGTGGASRDPGEVLAELLRALGVAEPALPAEVPARAALLRSRLSTMRMLLVLDDVAHAGQVRPLLPGAGACAVLATSRMRLPDLCDALQVNVDVLTDQEAQELFSRVAGRRRVVEQPVSARDILRACGHLPLAVRIAGAKLAQRPGWSLAVLADRLKLERHRLDELRAGDLAVRASVELSYRLLPPVAARAFRLLGTLGPGPVPAWVVSALIGAPAWGAGAPAAEDVVDLLVDANLLQLVGMDGAGQARYRLHDLLRCYGVELAEGDALVDRRAAIERVLDGWLALASSARERMPVHYFGVSAGALEAPFVVDPMAWFEAELPALVAAVELAHANGFDGHAWRIAVTLAPYLDLRGRRDTWWRVHQTGLASARRAGDQHGEAILLRDIGQLHLYRDRYEEAAVAFTTARELFGATGDTSGEAIALAGQGTVHRIAGRHHRALHLYRRALEVFERLGDRHSQAVVYGSMGLAHLGLRRYGPAQRWLTASYELAVELGDRHRQALALHRLATLRQERGRPDRARDELHRALALLEELGDDACAAYVRQSIGELHLRFGDPRRAGEFLADSLDVQKRLGDRRAEATIAALLGEWHGAAGRTHRAKEYLTRALSTWRDLAEPAQEAAVIARLRALSR